MHYKVCIASNLIIGDVGGEVSFAEENDVVSSGGETVFKFIEFRTKSIYILTVYVEWRLLLAV